VATKKQRQRQLARQAHQRRMQRQEVRARRNKQWAAGGTTAVIVVAVGVIAAFLAGAFGSSTGKPSAATSPSPSASATPTPTPTPSSTPAMVDGKCVYIKAGTAARKVSLPSATPDTKATYTATIKTNRGNIVIDMLNSEAPCTVNSFVSLADQRFYNNTHCHRLTTEGIFVLQCGDPTGTGEGGPGYEYGNENLPKANKSGEFTYTPGMVAMANTGAPDSNGSQFFLVYKDSPLPPDYTPFGTIASGLKIIQTVAKAGATPAGDGHPKEKVQIESVTVSKT
jgi:peptidyl-prolyl cis-trans isomerase B (cyclophilin B)